MSSAAPAAGPGLPGRLGLAASHVPHADRHGLLWLEYGRLSVQDGTLRFLAAQSETLAAGDYAIPYQAVSMLLLGPGTSLTHDVLRLAARHGLLLCAVGEGGVKSYTAPPMGQGRSDVARTRRTLGRPEASAGCSQKTLRLALRSRVTPSRY